MAKAFDWQPLAPFGAVVDLDLGRDIPDHAVAELQELYDRRRVLVFPHQELSGEDQQRVAGWFGPVISEAGQYLSTDPERGGLGHSAIAFHSDLACTEHPFFGLTLYGADVDGPSTTVFADAIGAAESLAPEVRARLEVLTAAHMWPVSLTERQRRATAPDWWPEAVHPVILEHPRTGEPILFVNASHTDRIVELDAEESDALIEELFGVLYAAPNTYAHEWSRGDLVVWDNFALQHARPPIADGVTRTLRRVCMATHSYSEVMTPEFVAAYNPR